MVPIMHCTFIITLVEIHMSILDDCVCLKDIVDKTFIVHNVFKILQIITTLPNHIL